MHTFARFLFLSLLNYYPDLAYEVGLRAMRLPLLEEHEDSDDPLGANASSSLIMSRPPRWFTLGHIETQQCALSSTMLSAAKGKFGPLLNSKTYVVETTFTILAFTHNGPKKVYLNV